jgi:peptide chain release factor 1
MQRNFLCFVCFNFRSNSPIGNFPSVYNKSIKSTQFKYNAFFKNLGNNVSIPFFDKNRFFSTSQRHLATSVDSANLKLLNAYNDSIDYIKSLVDEKLKLEKLMNNEAELSKEEKKVELFNRFSYLSKIDKKQEQIMAIQSELKELAQMMSNESNDEMKQMIEDDSERLQSKLDSCKIELVDLLIIDEEEDKEDVIMELSAGVGGLESRIFCSELFEMYRMYSESKNWSFKQVKIDTENTELGEMMRKAEVEINGNDVFKYLKYENGVHRVQRVPKTESKGRIHTSTVGVLVTPKPSEIKIELNPKELKIETKTSGGPGGQHANKTESAVRILHIPTGIMVYCDAERYQTQNKTRALNNLKHKLYQKAFEDQLNKRQSNRKLQIGSSSRSERIRTYNFIQDRITDHRLDDNFHNITKFLSGAIEPMINCLQNEHKLELLQEILDEFSSKK